MSLIRTKQGIRLWFLLQHQQACWNWSRLLSNVEEDAACGGWGERSLFTGLYVQFSNIYSHITYSSFKFDAIFDTCNQSQRESTTSWFSLFKKTKQRKDVIRKGFFFLSFFLFSCFHWDTALWCWKTQFLIRVLAQIFANKGGDHRPSSPQMSFPSHFPVDLTPSISCQFLRGSFCC